MTGDKQEPTVENQAEAKEEQANKKWQSFNEQQSNETEVSDVEPSLEHASYENLQEQLTAAEQKAQVNWDKFMRAQAEMDNLRRRNEKDVSNAYKYAQDKLLNALLPIVDSLERAIDSSQNEATNKAMLEGLELTMKLFMDTLDKQGVKQLNPKGEVFDPNFHQAISMQETQEVDTGCVLNVIQKGYKLHDRILRPALVVVAN
jgi:molecular chaperone GrpE